MNYFQNYRKNKIKKFLTKKRQIDKNKLMVKAYGEDRPVVDNESREG